MLTKLDIARHQLGTALDLFIDDRDSVAVQCLACGAGEILEAVAELEGVEPFFIHVRQAHPTVDIKELRASQRQYWNAFKHMTSKNGDRRDDSGTLASFSDLKNDAALFVGWFDYNAVAKKLPPAAQVFQAWWLALNEPRLSLGDNLTAIHQLFPDLTAAERAEQKRRLRCVVKKFQDKREILSDPRTENRPLCFPAT